MIGLVKLAHGNTELELREVALREPGEDEVVVRVRYAGICGTDIHIARDEFPSWPPVVLGHEFTGTVERVGAGVDPALAGRRIVCEPHASACHVCYLCRRGHPELCASKRSPGWGVNGAFASHIVVPAWLLHTLPDEVPDEVAVLAEPMAVVMTALRRASLAAGDFVLVIGPGPVGALAALACRAAGAANVVVAGRASSTARLGLLSDMGFTTLSSGVAQAARDMTSGRGADLVVECSGSAAGISIGIDAARRRGRLASIGLSSQPTVEVPWDLATSRALDVAFSMSSNYEAWEPGLTILARVAADVARLPTVYPLSAWRDAFVGLESRTVVKAVLDPTGASGERA
ncbi:MAG: alcohol dehydrogenase catalytic domain-containing protein [Candidatus Limnocylindrales bacterium]|jgi:L-iditol 2-dehydrogenase